MLSPISSRSAPAFALGRLDRSVIGYLVLPTMLFLVGWFKWWVGLPLVVCVCYALKPLWQVVPGAEWRLPSTRLHLILAIVVGCTWTLLGGADHLVFANPDWYVRDAVLHDLVSSPWPVGYGVWDGKESLLRAPVAFYLPAAVVGKVLGLSVAHMAMGLWTAAGSTLFLLQVLSLTPSRVSVALLVVTVVVFFSGLDIVGSLIMDGPRFRSDWNVTTHLEWWAHKYQYSSMTTQLFWVPNHALGGWLAIGLLYRNRRSDQLNRLLPLIVVAVALWSPLTALGLAPFVLLRLSGDSLEQRSWRFFHPKIWGATCVVGFVIAAYLLLDPSEIPKGITVGGSDSTPTTDLTQHAQFFLLEAGCLGGSILAIRKSIEIALALVILALLPLVYFGPGNDLVMRASIPSLTVLTIGACLALIQEPGDKRLFGKKMLLGGLLLIGAITPAEEFARAMFLPALPIDMTASLMSVSCGVFQPHYVAHVGGNILNGLMRPVHRLRSTPQAAHACDNPAMDLMLNWSFTPREQLHPSRPTSSETGIP